MKLQLNQKLSQQLALSQQLIQAIELLQLPTVDLEQTVKQFLDVNPFIEIEESSVVDEHDADEFREHYQHYDIVKPIQSAQDFEVVNNIPEQITLRNHLINQLLSCQLDQRRHSIGEAMIDAIDDNGFLTVSTEEIYQQAGGEYSNISLGDISAILETIQTFTPEGVGARSIQESLLIQLKLKVNKNNNIEIAKKIITEYFAELTQRKFKLIAKKMHIELAEIKSALDVIKQLTPKPGSHYTDNVQLKSDPELFVFKKNEKWHIALTKTNMTHIRVNHQYGELLKSSRGGANIDLAKTQYQEAQWLHRAICRRNETLLKVGNLILKKQIDFFNFGKRHLKPLNITDLSTELGIHESTVSRATNGKHIMTPHGVFELTYFLPSYVSTENGDHCSAVQVKSHIEDIIQHENNDAPFSDDAIAKQLGNQGIKISRRTVAKYREAMKILPSYQRFSDFK